MRQIISTTDGKFIGLLFDPAEPLMLNGAEFVPDKVQDLPDGARRMSNSNYVIDTKESA